MDAQTHDEREKSELQPNPSPAPGWKAQDRGMLRTRLFLAP